MKMAISQDATTTVLTQRAAGETDGQLAVHRNIASERLGGDDGLLLVSKSLSETTFATVWRRTWLVEAGQSISEPQEVDKEPDVESPPAPRSVPVN